MMCTGTSPFSSVKGSFLHIGRNGVTCTGHSCAYRQQQRSPYMSAAPYNVLGQLEQRCCSKWMPLAFREHLPQKTKVNFNGKKKPKCKVTKKYFSYEGKKG